MKTQQMILLQITFQAHFQEIGKMESSILTKCQACYFTSNKPADLFHYGTNNKAGIIFFTRDRSIPAQRKLECLVISATKKINQSKTKSCHCQCNPAFFHCQF